MCGGTEVRFEGEDFRNCSRSRAEAVVEVEVRGCVERLLDGQRSVRRVRLWEGRAVGRKNTKELLVWGSIPCCVLRCTLALGNRPSDQKWLRGYARAFLLESIVGVRVGNATIFKYFKRDGCMPI